MGNKFTDPDFLREIGKSDILGISETHIFNEIIDEWILFYYRFNLTLRNFSWWNYYFNVDDENFKNGALNIANELDNQNQTQTGFDSKTSRQNFPTLPRNYFSSSYEHGCAMQEIMSSLQVNIEFIVVDVISTCLHKT